MANNTHINDLTFWTRTIFHPVFPIYLTLWVGLSSCVSLLLCWHLHQSAWNQSTIPKELKFNTNLVPLRYLNESPALFDHSSLHMALCPVQKTWYLMRRGQSACAEQKTAQFSLSSAHWSLYTYQWVVYINTQIIDNPFNIIYIYIYIYIDHIISNHFR